MQLHPTRSVLDIAHRLEEAGFEAWCVGGAIRDELLGGTPLDWDLATSAKPAEVQALFGRSRTIPVGIEFGTVAVLDRAGVAHEITTFRRDVRTDGRHAEVEFGGSLLDDLARRDLTINAIAYRPRTNEIADPFDGRLDIERKIVRAVGDAEERMREDRLRALRAIRFAARYDFAIAPGTLAAIRSSAPHLTRLSAERVQQEMVKTMQQVQRPSEAFGAWRDTGALAVLIPRLGAVSNIALATLDLLPRDGACGRRAPERTSNRLAAMFLDLPAPDARAAMTALRFSKHEMNWTTSLVTAWRAVSEQSRSVMASRRASDEELRRWLAAIGRLHVRAFWRLASARWGAGGEIDFSPPALEIRRTYRRMMGMRHTAAVEISDLAIDGDDLRAAGIPPGPLYAKILRTLLDGVISDPARNTPSLLLAEAGRLAACFLPASVTQTQQ